MSNYFTRFKRWLTGEPVPEPGQSTGSAVMVKQLLKAIENTREVEYDCQQVFQLLDQYSEMEISGEEASELMPLVKHHLHLCRDCREEYEALMRILENAPAEAG